jgi:arylsulfatase A-like enzyme
MKLFRTWVVLLGLALVWAGAQVAQAQETLPNEPAKFQGRIDASRDTSVPDWPKPVKAPAGAPNVLLILLDDVGFGATATFGGPVATPELDKLASAGLRYNRFHVNALCSPTRASLLSGRNNHQLGFGNVSDFASGYPGYNSFWGRQYASIAKVLQQNGYSTAAFGKWHNTPFWEINAAGPFDRWPTSLGFDYFYGIMAGADSQWEPRLYRNTTPVEPPATPQQGYHFSADIANEAIRWLHQHDAVAPDKPFFLYFATSATHSPHHVPAEWIAKYKGKFDQGWDKVREESFARQKQLGVIPANADLTPRPAELPAWDSLSADQKKLLAHQMEVYAGFLAHTDYEVGRVIQAVHDEGRADDTLILYIPGDNGASGEGGLDGTDVHTPAAAPETLPNRLARLDDFGGEAFSNHYAAAWAWATDSPFQWTKQVASHLGGTRDPLIVSWPARIKDNGGLRSQFHHVIDIAPTIYEAAGIRFPTVVDGVPQAPLEGVSMVYTFDHPNAPSTHHVQYFEMLGNRGIYKDGWWAGARHLLPWEALNPNIWNNTPLGQHPWELYNLDEDYSQAHDLAATHPEKLKELQALFDSEARRNNVYPLIPLRAPLPSPRDGRTSFVYREGVSRIPLPAAPRFMLAHTITADVNVPSTGAQGVIIASGGRLGGFSLFVKNGYVIYEYNAFGAGHDRIVAPHPLAPGEAHIVFEFTPKLAPDAPPDVFGRVPEAAVGRLFINGVPAGSVDFAHFGGAAYETLDIGQDLGTAVSAEYSVPFAFTGKIQTVKVELQK